MRISKRLAGVMFALGMAVAGMSTASASVLISDTGNSFYSSSLDGLGVLDYQPLASVLVGGSNVQIGGFGVYGRAEQAGSIQFGIWDITGAFDPALQASYLSGGQSVGAGNAAWFNSPTLNFTLLADHKYSMGVVSTHDFAWGRTETFDSISGGGLTLLGESGDAFVALTPAGGFAGEPVRDTFTDYTGFRTSLYVASAGGALPPVPEPSEWAMLLAGLMVVAFVAKRQRRRNI